MSEEPGPPGEIAGQRELLSRLRAMVEAKDAENAVLRAELDAEARRRFPVSKSRSTSSFRSVPSLGLSAGLVTG